MARHGEPCTHSADAVGQCVPVGHTERVVPHLTKSADDADSVAGCAVHDAYAYPAPHAYAYPAPHAYPDPDPHADANPNPHADANPNPDADPNPDAGTD